MSPARGRFALRVRAPPRRTSSVVSVNEQVQGTVPAGGPRVLLVDDLRHFRAPRGEVVARTSEQAIVILTRAHEAGLGWSQVWLDHDLGEATGSSDTVGPVVDWVLDRARDLDRVAVETFYVHTSDEQAGAAVVAKLQGAGYAVRRVPAQPFLLR